MERRHAAPPDEDLTTLFRIVREVARTKRLSREDAEDFSQSIQVRLAETNYDLFRRFKGQSSLRTYLNVVVRRLLIDWQNREYGKWRPSVQAMRMGEFAVVLERLMYRDSYRMPEAIQLVSMRTGAPRASELQALAAAIPPRLRRKRVSDEVLFDTHGTEFEDPLLEREARATEVRIRRALANALDALPAEDRELINLRYAQSRSVQAVAEGFAIEPKRLYRRFDRVLQSLRDRLVQEGITGPQTLAAQAGGRVHVGG